MKIVLLDKQKGPLATKLDKQMEPLAANGNTSAHLTHEKKISPGEYGETACVKSEKLGLHVA